MLSYLHPYGFPFRDISQLAKAAVSGDEAALDMFNWKKGKSNVKLNNSPFAPAESLSFFVGGASGKFLSDKEENDGMLGMLGMSIQQWLSLAAHIQVVKIK